MYRRTPAASGEPKVRYLFAVGAGIKQPRPEGPNHVEIRGARVHNLRGIDVDVSLGSIVTIADISGSGKSSLALGVLYAEGSRRYLEVLFAYTRRRMITAAKARIDSIDRVPATLVLRQRPAVLGVRSTFGTMSELLNYLRLFPGRGLRCAPTTTCTRLC